ncbi:MAG TPA: hypothetical protein PLJ27_14610 [Polyangiaceae bacterium]|jgi:hypothetical protein|nr:MAG: hypothetical protein BWY17_01433 [Deltaproteobacteria bacterium ADurb.Bin207]HNS96422.1 hypothetical protein [Polyangiaceae bacterium]HNZ22891.1 hypothetical protein [Polyangiaceae bacterium]HOD21278.1 hypothetical protein [Polyangiaceae bacterium]HOE48437.1 hypothetical protein [Polyangiaceae bacterium]
MATTGFSAAAALTCLGWSLTALGQETPSTTTQLASATPYTVAEFGVGILALPTTDICLAQPNTCTKGDLTPHGWIWMLYRASSEFVVGAGTSLARPFSGETTKRTEQIEREHIRQYMMIDVTGRYYGLRLPSVEGWLGMTFGGAVISDQYKTTGEASDAVILGPAGVVVRTEGLSAGIAAGLGWAFAPNWTLESSFRSAWWFLPSDRACGTTVDCATLSDDVAIFSLGIGVGYRISL